MQEHQDSRMGTGSASGSRKSMPPRSFHNLVSSGGHARTLSCWQSHVIVPHCIAPGLLNGLWPAILSLGPIDSGRQRTPEAHIYVSAIALSHRISALLESRLIQEKKKGSRIRITDPYA